MTYSEDKVDKILLAIGYTPEDLERFHRQMADDRIYFNEDKLYARSYPDRGLICICTSDDEILIRMTLSKAEDIAAQLTAQCEYMRSL